MKKLCTSKTFGVLKNSNYGNHGFLGSDPLFNRPGPTVL